MEQRYRVENSWLVFDKKEGKYVRTTDGITQIFLSRKQATKFKEQIEKYKGG